MGTHPVCSASVRCEISRAFHVAPACFSDERISDVPVRPPQSIDFLPDLHIKFWAILRPKFYLGFILTKFMK